MKIQMIFNELMISYQKWFIFYNCYFDHRTKFSIVKKIIFTYQINVLRTFIILQFVLMPERESQLERKMFIDITVLNIMINIFFGGLFYWFSTSEARYESPDCETLRYYSYIYALATFAITIFYVFIVLVACCTQDVSDVRQIYSWVNYLYGWIAFFLIISIFVALFKNEPCGDLRILVMICFVITIFFAFCYCCVFMLGALHK
ncbi:hypothetical protein pb186bvf_001227 [Paramecium bursaria]